jgi:hypothetical protein
MSTAETSVPTLRASRYLVQLCEHLDQIGRHSSSAHGQPPHARVEWTDRHGVIELPTGRCTLDATDDQLTVRVEADDPAELSRMQRLFADRLATIGRRDGLAVTW